MPPEGELRPGIMQDTKSERQNGPVEQRNSVKRVEREYETHPRQSKRPKITQDYRKLDDPLSELSDEEFDSIPELIRDPENTGPDDERPVNQAELIYTMIDENSAAPENPKSLKETHDSPEWPEWEKAI